MFLPLEIICNIYKYLNIETKLVFHKIYGHKFFKFNKLMVSNKRNLDIILINKLFKIQLRNVLLRRINF